MIRAFLRRLPLVLGGVLLLSANAQQAVGVSPPRLEWALEPGAVKAGKVTIFTAETGEVRVLPTVVDWLLSPTGSVIVLPNGGAPYSARDWIQLATDPFTVRPDADITVPFTLRVPESASGSYWAALSFTTSPVRPEKEKLNYLIQVRALAIVYVTIAGTERPGAKIARFEREGDDLVLDVQNTGNTYLRLKGSLRFLNPEGKTVRAQKLPERVLLRDGLVRMKLKLPKDLPEDAVIAAVEVWAEKPVPLPERLYAEVPLR